MKDDTALRAALAQLVPGARIATLVPLRTGPRARSYRADVVAQGRAQSWVVKHFPDDSQHAAAEFSSYALLKHATGIAPAFVAADPVRRILVVEFLSHAVDLFVALRRANDAVVIVRALARTIARLITATPQTTPGADGVAAVEYTALTSAWPRVDAWARSFDLAVSDDVRRAIARVGDRYAGATPACLTQGDPAPSNVVFTTTGDARLVDFEYGATRHVLADLAQWWIRCPLPEPWFEAMVDEVRGALIAARVYADADAFDEDLAYITSYAALYMFTWLPIERTLAEDAPWVGAWRVRQALLSSSERGMRAARSVAALAPLSDWLGELNAALRRAWPDSGDGAPDWNTIVGKRV